ncbi:MAG: TolB family protein [Chitinispirillaceae bacterium]
MPLKSIVMVFALCLFCRVYSAQQLTEVSTNTYGIVTNGTVYYLDYYMPDQLTFYAAIHAHDLNTNSTDVLLPQDGSSPYFIYFGVTGNHLPHVLMQNSTGGGAMPKLNQGEFGPGGGSMALYLKDYDLTSGSSTRIVSDSSWKEMVWAGGDYVTWIDYRHITTTDSNNGEIYLYSYTSGAAERVTQTPWWESSPFTDGNTVVWVSYENGEYGNVYYRDVSGGTPQAVSPGTWHQDKPRVYGRYIVWEDYRNAGTDPTNADIFACDLQSGEIFEVCTEENFQGNPYISGSVVVWEDYRNESSDGINADIYGYDISSNLHLPVVVQSGYQGNPTIHNDTVCWLSMSADSTMWLYLDTINRSSEVRIKKGQSNTHAVSLHADLSAAKLVLSGMDGRLRGISLYDTRGRCVNEYDKVCQGSSVEWVFDRKLSAGRYIIWVHTTEGRHMVNEMIGY